MVTVTIGSMRAGIFAALAIASAVSPGCASTDKQEAATATDAAVGTPAWVSERLGSKKGQGGSLAMGTSDYAAGSNRLAFLVLRKNNEVIQTARAKVYVGLSGAREPKQYQAKLVPIGVSEALGGQEHHDVPAMFYSVNVEFPQSGSWWIVVEPEGETIHATGVAQVRQASTSPAVGTKAYPSRNPTVADAPATSITTSRPPDTPLLRYSIADSLKAHAPFVVVFATPALCQSRTCGPVVEVVNAVRKLRGRSDVRFIHVEVYKNNDLQQGLNRWMQEWNLPTEPWVFVVDRNGVIRAKFEGPVSLAELAASVRNTLG
jgi:hypothetical protein